MNHFNKGTIQLIGIATKARILRAPTIFRERGIRPLVALCSLWLGAFCLARSAWADIEVVVDLYHVAGNLTVAQRDA